MTAPIDRLRTADPAAGLGPQPDERAEADLHLLLAEPQPAAAPPVARERRRLAPVLVTAVVAIVVIALTATVLAFVHPRTDVGGSTDASSCGSAPFACGPYFSTGGTGSVAFLGTDLFRLDFAREDGRLTAVLSGRCNALNIRVAVEGNTLVGSETASTAMLCAGAPGAQDHAVSAFFSGTPTYRIDGQRLTFTAGSSSATFSSDIGACRPARATSPFCGTSTATGGSGSVAFLSDPYRITFGQEGTRLTMLVQGLCGTTTYDVTVGSSTFRLERSAVTTHSCPEGANAHDVALAAFLAAPLTWRWDGTRLTLASAASGPFSSAVFQR